MGIITLSCFLICSLCEGSQAAARKPCDLFVHSSAATTGSKKRSGVKTSNHSCCFAHLSKYSRDGNFGHPRKKRRNDGKTFPTGL